MNYSIGFQNDSATVSGVLGKDLLSGRHRAVMWDEKGLVCVADGGASAFGVLLSSTADERKKGDSVDVLIKNIGLLEVAEAVSVGDFVSINELGQGVKASSGMVIFGRAMSAGSGENAVVQVLIMPCGATM